MSRRFITIWFRYLKTDWFIRRQPVLNQMPFVLASPDHGRMIITAASKPVQIQGVDTGMAVADARAIIPSLQVLDDKPGLEEKLLKVLAEWCIRFTPVVAVDPPCGLILDVTGCAHLWGSEKQLLTDIIKRFKGFGYNVRAAMAGTIGTAWAIARFGQNASIIESGQETSALLPLPPAALRFEEATIERLEKLGLRQVSNFINMPRATLRRRFGQHLLARLDEALGNKEEVMNTIYPVEAYQERLPCLEPIVTATGIEIALQRLLDSLCGKLRKDEKGIRAAVFKGYRMDGKIEKIEIGTNKPSHNDRHIFKLFEIKIGSIEPDLGIELFTLEATKTEDVLASQEKLWENNDGLDDTGLSELLDRLAVKIGAHYIHRYLPDEHYWPERSFKQAVNLNEKIQSTWRSGRLRPLQILFDPQLIEVTAPIPDYPPMLFRYKGRLHKIIKADGPERIEQEWWMQQGKHRDYYRVEDEDGHRYWLFRSGHYDINKTYQWFIHGFFA